ncbi:hypothetical protein H072_6373 [Dactylellina haptotyla CBS 200.50]|uniref:Uncharacterized protein n=1 Tax=Dactylellina haptotyla (strain CBS 200.50) TaxID=1284197 RepID=S8AAF6_DACHA|nr:hypothetical protein H072_6373 [Dactylellina haptotyla CBS 200.50]
MRFSTLLLTLLPATPIILAQGLFDDAFTVPWSGTVGPVPRFECTCDCGDEAISKQVTIDLCKQAIELGRKKEIKLLDDGKCAFWGLDVQLYPGELGGAWGKEVCTEKGCSASSACDYVACSGVERKKWVAPAPVVKEGKKFRA